MTKTAEILTAITLIIFAFCFLYGFWSFLLLIWRLGSFFFRCIG